LRLIAKGPGTTVEKIYGTHGVKKPPLVTDIVQETGGEHV
jgi:hypothetical protein